MIGFGPAIVLAAGQLLEPKERGKQSLPRAIEGGLALLDEVDQKDEGAERREPQAVADVLKTQLEKIEEPRCTPQHTHKTARKLPNQELHVHGVSGPK